MTEIEELELIFLPFFPDFFSKLGRPRNGLLEIIELLGFGETPNTILGEETRARFSISKPPQEFLVALEVFQRDRGVCVCCGCTQNPKSEKCKRDCDSDMGRLAGWLTGNGFCREALDKSYIYSFGLPGSIVIYLFLFNL